jgi:hypothetical protein
MTDADEIANLKRELAEVKAKVAGPPPPLNNANFVDEMRAISERRMNFASPPLTRDEVKAMNDACGPGGVKDIVAKGGVPGPTGMLPTSGQIGAIHSNVGLPGSQRSGWINSAPIGPPPGVAQADKLMDAQDHRDRVELAERIAKQKLASGS